MLSIHTIPNLIQTGKNRKQCHDRKAISGISPQEIFVISPEEISGIFQS